MRVAQITFSLCSALLLLIGLVYLLHPGPMPYHLKFIKKQPEELTTEMLALIVFAKEAVGALLFSVGVALLFLTLQIKTRAPWVRWAVAAIMTPILITFLHITLSIGLYTPWWAVVICIVCIAIGFWAAKPKT